MTRPLRSTQPAAVSLDIQQAIAQAFEMAMHGGGTPPIMALEQLAEALGAVYSDVAWAHVGESACPCGWVPHMATDLGAMCTALRKVPEAKHRPTLRTMRTAGSA